MALTRRIVGCASARDGTAKSPASANAIVRPASSRNVRLIQTKGVAAAGDGGTRNAIMAGMGIGRLVQWFLLHRRPRPELATSLFRLATSS